MKKLTFGMLATAALLMTGCANDEPFANGNGYQDGCAIFQVELPGAFNTRAVADGLSATDLTYAVFSSEGNFLFQEKVVNAFDKGDRTANVKIPLVNDMSYKVAFFAQSPESADIYKINNGVLDIDYAAECTANLDKYDAFYAVEDIDVNPNMDKQKVTLTRPFAQVNIGASDWAAAKTAGVLVTDATLTYTADVYKTLNLVDGTVDNKEAVNFELNTLPDATGAKTAETFVPAKLTVEKSVYDHIAMTYVLVPAAATTVNTVTFTYHNPVSDVDKDLAVNSVPVQRNFRTNIIGTFFTQQIDYDIIIDQKFEDEYNIPNEPVLPNGVTVKTLEANNAIAVVEAYSPTRASGEYVYPKTFKDALTAVSTMTDGAIIYFHPDAVVSGNAHMGTTIKNLVIYANGATFTTDLAIDTYDNQGSTNSLLSNDQNIEIYDARNLYVWGQGLGDYKRNIKMVNCKNVGTSPVASAGRLIYLTGTSGTTNITLINCEVEKSDSPVYSNASGNISLIGCTFTDCAVPVNINFKDPAGVQNDLVENCRFIRCGATSAMGDIAKYAAPLRFVKAAKKSENKDFSKSQLNLTIRNTVCEGTIGSNGDLLTTEKRENYDWWPINIVYADPAYCKPAQDASGAYLVSTPGEFAYAMTTLAETANTAITVEINSDINMSGVTVAHSDKGYSGAHPAKHITLKGNNHTISNLNVRGLQATLFAWTASGFDVSDLTIKDSSFIGTNAKDEYCCAAAFGAFCDVTGVSVSNCTLDNVTVGGGKYAGGFVAYCSGTSSFTDCVVKNSNFSSDYNDAGESEYKGHIGAIIGGSYGNTMTRCKVENTSFEVLGNRGGIFIGSLWKSTTADNCSVSNVTGLTDWVGSVGSNLLTIQ